MAVVARGSKWQVNRTVRGVRAPRLTFDTKQEAEAWEAEVVAAIMAGREIPVPEGRRAKTKKPYAEGTLGQVARAAWEQYWKGTPSEKHTLFAIKAAEEYFGEELHVSKITKARIEDYVKHLKGLGNSGATINRKLSALSKILGYAEGRYIEQRPRIERQRETLPEIRVLSPEEEKAMISLFRQWELHDHADALIVFTDSGMRMSELWRARGRDIVSEHGQLIIRQTKTRSNTTGDRIVPMTKRVREILEARRDRFGISEKLFPGMDNYKYRRAWERAKVVLKIDDKERFTPYITRHTCASRLVRSGASLSLVKDWLGHTSIATTMRYASLAPNHLKRGVEALESYT